MGSLQTIDHIVVLMLENRSFDSLLGSLYPKSDSFEGLNGTEQNPDANGSPVGAWNSPGTDETTMRIPNPDPGELWTDINMQLFGDSAPAPGHRPTMVGFVQNYLAQRQLNRQQTYDPTSVMHYFAPAQLPVLSQLAQKFAVCDHWFASAPCQTWPNRWFVHTARCPYLGRLAKITRGSLDNKCIADGGAGHAHHAIFRQFQIRSRDQHRRT